MDQAKIKRELEKLAAEGMPEQPPEEQAPEEAVEPGGDAKAKGKKEEEKPRLNGLLVTEFLQRGSHLDAQVNADQVVRAAEILDAEGMTLEAVTGVDWISEGQFELVYDYSYTGGKQFRVVVRARINRDQPDIPTVSTVFPGANWHERETWDLLGINFVGHPQLERFLLPDDADFFPLRKDYKP